MDWKNKDEVKKYHKVRSAEWYEKNKAIHALRGKDWNKKPENKNKRVKYATNYRKRNRDKVNEYRRKHYRTYPEQNKAKEFRHSVIGRFKIYKNNATKKGKEFSLSFEEFSKLIILPCSYCGEKKITRGIDRIDNTKGYSIKNSTPCCKLCNFMKKTMTVREFLEHIKKIYLYNGL